MAGVNADNGKLLEGFDHVQQSLGKIWSTPQGERVMREWFGNPGLRLLGENATAATILQWFTILWVLGELFEPRFKITRFDVTDINDLGYSDFTVMGEHKPYAHLSFQQARAFVSVTDNVVTLSPA